MNMIREFVNYFLAVMMGRRDSLTSFLEPLTMGERYLRWGMESRDIRDFRSAMDHLHLCHDRDAPMASLLLRKYNCIGDVCSAAISTLMAKHQRVIEDTVKMENKYRDELNGIEKKLTEIKEYIRKLQEEGSLIKAKSEEARMADMSENAQRLIETLDSGEIRTAVYDSYDEISADALRFFREVDHAMSLVLGSTILGESAATGLANHLRGKLEFLRGQIDELNPIDQKKLAEAKAAEAKQTRAAAGPAKPAGKPGAAGKPAPAPANKPAPAKK